VYQIVGLPLLLKVFAWLVAILALMVAAATILMEVPTGWGWAKLALSAAGTGIGIGMAVVAVLANGRVFPWCCRQRWTFGVFPDLAGEWVGELRSNWPRIAARSAENVGDISLLPRPAHAKITTNLFTLCMELATDDRYSTSRTFTSGLSKDPTTGEVAVSYLYENTTLDPKSTDVSIHQGAAKLTLRREGDDLVLEGPYWTNRGWNRGLNTAGIAIFRKPMRG
jgi:hypothetical protein